MCAIFGDPWSRDGDLRHKKNRKNGDFWIENLLINHLTHKVEIRTQLGCL